jgi:DNA binding domain, excisionase family
MFLDHPHAPGRLLEVAHVAHRLSVSVEFVRRLIRTKQLRAIRMGRRWRVAEADLMAWIDAQRVPQVEPIPGQHRGRDGPRPLPEARNA